MNNIMKKEIKIKKLRETAVLPTRGSSGAAGLDLYACLDGPVTVEPHGLYKIPTGVAVALPDKNTVGLIFARSGLGVNHGVSLPNAVGVIDSDYRGELIVGIGNTSGKPYVLSPGERFAQLVVMPVYETVLKETADLGATERGAGAFGSTGKSGRGRG
ncbi:MAG: dUTP diphosphatase [Oscillospiraceae bacterium]|jgi:dUTP pyrophosphatase|nr:dUTP diphosphatase [Oscillospiraceae bacterium]MCI1989743.1 dUTP diphosphatase [Oscillospiraceae bacterium]MCI2034346.1 dUTP diphosphatase [Oscillospiraceae bacterium]